MQDYLEELLADILCCQEEFVDEECGDEAFDEDYIDEHIEC